MKTALVVKEGLLRGAASLYRMDPPYEGQEYVIASSIDNMWGFETYLFPSNPSGEVTDWLEMEGSQRGTDSHYEIFSGIGYTIVREQ